MTKIDDDKAEAAMKNDKFKFTIELDWYTIHGVLVSGIEGDMTRQWAYIDVGKHEPGWANYFTATFEDHADGQNERGKGKKYKLSKSKILEGLTIIREKYPRHFADILNENSDSITGDVLIQCSVLGDVVYG